MLRKQICFVGISDDLPKLQYTFWCIKETLRLRPPVPEVFRELTEDVEFEGLLIPKGRSVKNVSVYSKTANGCQCHGVFVCC